MDHMPGAPCAGLRIRDGGWPVCSNISSLRRGNSVLVPNGKTIIHTGDTLVIVVEPHEQAEIQRLCQTKAEG
jgi:Trk K+ transport system NAD-binding subunit